MEREWKGVQNGKSAQLGYCWDKGGSFEARHPRPGVDLHTAMVVESTPSTLPCSDQACASRWREIFVPDLEHRFEVTGSADGPVVAIHNLLLSAPH
jgi:hypothetical protein